MAQIEGRASYTQILGDGDVTGSPDWNDITGKPTGIFSSSGEGGTKVLDNEAVVSALGYTPFDQAGGEIDGNVDIGGNITVDGDIISPFIAGGIHANATLTSETTAEDLSVTDELSIPTISGIGDGDDAPGGGVTTWDELQEKPFESVGSDFTVSNGVLGISSSALPDVAWGSISGLLSDQSDLQTALDDKYDTSGGDVGSVRLQSDIRWERDGEPSFRMTRTTNNLRTTYDGSILLEYVGSSDLYRVNTDLDVHGSIDADVLTAGATELDHLTVAGDTTIQGDLTVLGSEFIANTETVEITDNLAVINSGETGDGVTAGFAGWEVDRGTAENFLFGFDENRSRFVVGQDEDTQVVATRENAPSDQALAFYNANENRFETDSDLTWDGSSLDVDGTIDVNGHDNSIGPWLIGSDIDNGQTRFTPAEVIQTGGMHIYRRADAGNQLHIERSTNSGAIYLSNSSSTLAIFRNSNSLIQDYLEVRGDLEVGDNLEVDGSAQMDAATIDTSLSIPTISGVGDGDDAPGGGGVTTWDELEEKPFESVGSDFTVSNGVLGISSSALPDVAWGSISGLLSDQSDLQNELDAIEDNINDLDNDKLDASALPLHYSDTTFANQDLNTSSGPTFEELTLTKTGQLLAFGAGYDVYREDTGVGSDDTRLWFDAPVGGEITLGPRGGGDRVERIRLETDELFVNGGSGGTGLLNVRANTTIDFDLDLGGRFNLNGDFRFLDPSGNRRIDMRWDGDNTRWFSANDNNTLATFMRFIHANNGAGRVEEIEMRERLNVQDNLNVTGDITNSTVRNGDWVRKDISFGTDNNYQYILLFQTSDTAERIVGQIRGWRNSGSSNFGTALIDITAGVGSGGDHDIAVSIQHVGRSVWDKRVVELDYDGNSYYAIELYTGISFDQPQEAYFEGYKSRDSYLEVVEGQGSVSNVSPYSSNTHNRENWTNTKAVFDDGVLVGGSAQIEGPLTITEDNYGVLRLARGTGNPSIVPASGENWMIVDGAGSGLGLNYYDDSDVIIARGGGDVGIGTSNPQAKLDVNGMLTAGALKLPVL